MKRFIKSIFLFSLIFIGIYCILIFVHGTFMPEKINPFKSSYGHLYSKLQEIKKFKNVDILFLGGSNSYRGFDTRLFQKHEYYTFNLRSSSQTLLQTNILLKRYLEKLNPKLIVLAVFPDLF